MSKQKRDLMCISVTESHHPDYVLSLITHEPPTDYEYEAVQFKRDIVAVWILCHRRFIYNGGSPTRTIWGFYNTKTKCWHAPINSKQIGDVVDINSTTPYTTMPLNLNPLEYALYS